MSTICPALYIYFTYQLTEVSLYPFEMQTIGIPNKLLKSQS